MMKPVLVAALLCLAASSAYAEGPQEQALDHSLSQPDADQGQSPAPQTRVSPSGGGDDPSQVVSRPTQTEPAHEGPEEKALDRSLQETDQPQK